MSRASVLVRRVLNDENYDVIRIVSGEFQMVRFHFRSSPSLVEKKMILFRAKTALNNDFANRIIEATTATQ